VGMNYIKLFFSKRGRHAHLGCQRPGVGKE
jgi:hypothetical protein